MWFKKIKNPAFWRYTAIFFLLICAIFGPYFVGANTLIWNADGITQHFPALLQWQTDLKGILFQHQWPAQWNWNISLGQDYLQTFSYYVMGDLFTYPIAFFSAKMVPFYYSCMIIVRLWLAGIAFIYAAPRILQKRVTPNALALSATLYVFSGYVAFAAFEHPFFINPLIIWPLLLLSLLHLIRNKKWIPFTLMVAWTLWNNFYFAWSLGIATGLVWIFLLIQKRSVRAQFVHVIGAGGLGFLISSPLFIPSALATMKAARAGDTLANGLIVYPISYYLTLPGKIIGNDLTPSFWLTGGLTFISVVAIVHSFRHFQTFKYYNYIWLGSIICLLIPALAACFNGGTSPSNRWVFLLSLPIALICLEYLSHINQQAIERPDLHWATGVGVLSAISLLAGDNFNLNTKFGFLIAAYFAGILGLSFLYLPLNRRKKIWIGGLVLFNLFVLMVRNHTNDSNPKAATTMTQTAVQNLMSQQKEIKGALLPHERVYLDNQLGNATGISPASNIPLIAGINNVESYWSLQNRSLGQFMKGFQIPTASGNDVTGDLDQRNVLLNTLGVSSIFTSKISKLPPTYQNNLTSLNQLKRGQSLLAYPQFYVPKHKINQKAYKQFSATQKEAAIADAVVVPRGGQQHSPFEQAVQTALISDQGSTKWQKKVHQTYNSMPSTLPNGIMLKANPKLAGTELHLEITNLTYQPASWQQRLSTEINQYQFNYRQELANPNSPKDLQYNPANFKYNWFMQNLTNLSPKINGYTLKTTYQGQDKTVYQPGQNNLSFYQKRRELTLNLGAAKDIKHDQFIPITFSQIGQYKYQLKIKAIPIDDRFAKVAKSAQTSAPKHVNYGKDTIDFNYHCDQPQVLATTIPWSTGWTSANQKLIKINNGLLGIQLQAGTNHIHLEYHTPGLKLGLLLGLLGLGLLVLILIYHVYRYLKQRKLENV